MVLGLSHASLPGPAHNATVSADSGREATAGTGRAYCRLSTVSEHPLGKAGWHVGLRPIRSRRTPHDSRRCAPDARTVHSGRSDDVDDHAQGVAVGGAVTALAEGNDHDTSAPARHRAAASRRLGPPHSHRARPGRRRICRQRVADRRHRRPRRRRPRRDRRRSRHRDVGRVDGRGPAHRRARGRSVRRRPRRSARTPARTTGGGRRTPDAQRRGP